MSAPLHGLVLAGGRSERMGRDKGALAYHGRPQVLHVADLLTPFTDKVFISIRKAQEDAPHLAGLPTVIDRYTPSTPLNGIVSAMRPTPEAAWLVVAVDMPWVDAGVLGQLIERRDRAAIATCFESPAMGGPDPLLAIWEPGHVEALEEFLLIREHACPRAALKRFGARVLAGCVDPQAMANINTPEERAAWQENAA